MSIKLSNDESFFPPQYRHLLFKVRLSKEEADTVRKLIQERSAGGTLFNRAALAKCAKDAISKNRDKGLTTSKETDQKGKIENRKEDKEFAYFQKYGVLPPPKTANKKKEESPSGQKATTSSSEEERRPLTMSHRASPAPLTQEEEKSKVTKKRNKEDEFEYFCKHGKLPELPPQKKHTSTSLYQSQ